MGALEEGDPTLTPVDVPNLRWLNGSTLMWDPVATAAEYHV